ncbi:unnamed protein product, partial [Prorocentrum cordatum]
MVLLPVLAWPRSLGCHAALRGHPWPDLRCESLRPPAWGGGAPGAAPVGRQPEAGGTAAAPPPAAADGGFGGGPAAVGLPRRRAGPRGQRAEGRGSRRREPLRGGAAGEPDARLEGRLQYQHPLRARDGGPSSAEAAAAAAAGRAAAGRLRARVGCRA